MATTPLEAEIRRRIAMAGPMPVRQYMELCLSHPVHGYYMTRDPFGRGGDFITAPEISQMFGELLGLWAASVWHRMGQPENVRLVELGPGRGTMMLDALRAAQVVPAFRAAIVLHLVEISPALQQRQQQALAALDVPVMWHQTLRRGAGRPRHRARQRILRRVAGEPGDQAVQRLVRARGRDRPGRQSGVRHRQRADPAVRSARAARACATRRSARSTNGAPTICRSSLGRRLVHQGGAALVIDYGHVESAAGDTLQAVGGHAFVDPLESPGEVDLTAHVDFQALALAAESMGARVIGPDRAGASFSASSASRSAPPR